jgi:hypothetical protein
MAKLPDLLRMRRERLGYMGDDGITLMASAAAVTVDRWREFEAGAAAPAPEELPRIALALVHDGETGPDDDPGLVLARLRSSIAQV